MDGDFGEGFQFGVPESVEIGRARGGGFNWVGAMAAPRWTAGAPVEAVTVT